MKISLLCPKVANKAMQALGQMKRTLNTLLQGNFYSMKNFVYVVGLTLNIVLEFIFNKDIRM